VTGVKQLRQELLSQATGHVLEIAAGNGTNFEYYPSPQVKQVLAVDFSPAMLQQVSFITSQFQQSLIHFFLTSLL
jgi:ubiquinone/menaquinone biosynthesis C-methylase UbiE